MNIVEDLYQLQVELFNDTRYSGNSTFIDGENTALEHFQALYTDDLKFNLRLSDDIIFNPDEKFYFIGLLSYIKVKDIVKQYSIDSNFLKKIKELLKEDNFRLVLLDVHESYKHEEVKTLFNLFDDGHEKIIFINNDSNLKNLNHTPYVKTLKTNFLWNNEVSLVDSKIFTSAWNEEKRNKMFLCNNKEGKEHRFLIISLLDMYGLLDNTNYSFLKKPQVDKDFNGLKDFRIKDFKDLENYLKINYNRLQKPKVSDFEIHSDGFKNVENLIETNHNFAGEVNTDDYKNSYINIVTESVYWHNAIHITEKSYKPFHLGILPIFVASHNHVKTLRDDYSLDLFDDFINHDYDKELDNTKRLKMIIEECLRLSKLENEIIDFYKNNKDRFLTNIKKIADSKKQKDNHVVDTILKF